MAGAEFQGHKLCCYMQILPPDIKQKGESSFQVPKAPNLATLWAFNMLISCQGLSGQAATRCHCHLLPRAALAGASPELWLLETL